MSRGLLALAVVTASLAGCGGSSTRAEPAESFVKQVTVEFSRGQAGRLWEQLVPAEQAVVPRSLYVSCAGNGFRLRSFKILERYDESVPVLGKELPATAVSVQVVSDDGVTTATIHAVRDRGRWHWVLSRSQLASLRSGRCP